MLSTENIKKLSNKALVKRINHLFSKDKNDDDEITEMVIRRDAGKLKFKALFDTYELIN